MSAPDLHPEELLDKAAAGTLLPSEQEWLDAHLAQCTVCRFEVQARADFAATSGPALDVDNLVTRALAGMPPRPERVFTARSRRRSVAMLGAAALLFFAMGSFAAVTGWSNVWPKLVEAFTAPTALAPPAPAPAPVHAPLAVRHDEPEPPRAEAAEEPGVAIAPPAPLAPVHSASAPVPVARRAVAPVIREEEESTPAIPPPAPVLVAVAAPPLPDAGGMFAEANHARVAGQRAQAVQLYHDLLERYPQAPEARLSQATLGRLLLDTGDPSGALVQLDSYLGAGELTLREEVLCARADALARLGRVSEEAQAWQALLDGYPDSIHAARAQARLLELGGR